MINTQDTTVFERNGYEELCIEMRELLMKEKEIAVRKDCLRKEIIDMSGGDRMEYGIKVQNRSAKGGIDYPKYIKTCDIDESILEFYRKPERNYCEVRSY